MNRSFKLGLGLVVSLMTCGALHAMPVTAMPGMEAAPKEVPAAQPVTTVRVGEVAIKMPTPEGYERVANGSAQHKTFLASTAESNRLLAGFIPTAAPVTPEAAEAPEDIVEETPEKPGMSRYSMVQTLRGIEDNDFTQKDFDDVKVELKNMDSNLESIKDQVNKELKSLTTENEKDTVQVGKPIMLGTFLNESQALGFNMVIKVKTGNKEDGFKELPMACGTLIMRVNDRLLFVYVYDEYKGDDTLKWISTHSTDWAHAILKANQPVPAPAQP